MILMGHCGGFVGWAEVKWSSGRGGPAPHLDPSKKKKKTPHLVNAYKDLDVILFYSKCLCNECNVLSSFQIKVHSSLF